MLKNLLFIISTLIATSLHAQSEVQEELNFVYQIEKQNKIQIIKTYIGEPVSKTRTIVINQICRGKKTELFNMQECDFNEFILTPDGKLNFNISYYNPTSGICTSPNKKAIKLTYQKNCK